jgi:hypothetical protein
LIDRVQDPKKVETSTLKVRENSRAWRWNMVEKRRYPRVSVRLPLEYWETDDACHGALLGNVSERGMLIYSIKKIRVGAHLNVRVFFNNGYKFDAFQVRGKIVWKEDYSEEKWEGYQYGLELTGILREDRHKLALFLMGGMSLENSDGSIQSVL